VERALTSIIWRGKQSFLVVVRDINERKRVEAALHDTEERYRSLYNDTPAMMYSIDQDIRLVSVSDYWLKKFGYERDEVIGRRPTEFMIEESRRRAEEIYIPAFMKTGELRDIEYRFVKKDGQVLDLLLSATAARTADGKIQRSLAVMIDITERKRVEAILAEKSEIQETTFESMSQGNSVYDGDTRLIAFNRKFSEIFGFAPGFLRVGMSYEQVARFIAERGDYGEGDVDTLVDERMNTARSGKTRRVEREIRDGTVLSIWRNPLPDGGFVTTFTDITELKQTEEKLRNAKEAAELASRSKSEFLANMSHELRTPLNAIIGFSEIMLNEMFGKLGNVKYKDYAGDINQSGKHLRDVINDILDLSKIEAGKLDLHEEVLDLKTTIDSSMRVVKERAEERRIALSTQIDEDLPHVFVDERKVKQILINLLSNAIKFTPDDGRVSLSAARGRDRGLKISVADNGIGMKPADIANAFVAFGQVDSMLSRKFEGTGLGLPLTKSLVELHGGSLRLDSAPGEGTTATVRFPPHRFIAPGRPPAAHG